MENTELLRSIFLFKHFSAMETLPFNKVLESIKYKAGTKIINQGEIADSMYIIKSGSVEVYLEEADSSIPLAILSAVDHFGEMALLDDSPRSACIRAINDVIVLRIKRQALETILEKNPASAMKFYKAMSISLADRLRNSNEAIFKARDSLRTIIPAQ